MVTDFSRRHLAATKASCRIEAQFLHVAAIVFVLLLIMDVSRARLQAATFEAGGLLFSDERGGFRLVSASGQGTPNDPIILVEEFSSLRPAVLTIRPAVPATYATPARGHSAVPCRSPTIARRSG